MSGKGDSPRPYSVDQSTFDSNWDKIFGTKTPQELDDLKALDDAFAAVENFNNINGVKNNAKTK
jgi:hypothetical protein